MIRVSLHAYDRAKQRMGLNKKAIERLASIAYYKGIKLEEVRGSFLRYIQEHFKYQKNHNVIIFANMVFLYDREFLVTVVHLPAKYQKCVKQLLTKHKKASILEQ